MNFKENFIKIIKNLLEQTDNNIGSYRIYYYSNSFKNFNFLKENIIKKLNNYQDKLEDLNLDKDIEKEIDQKSSLFNNLNIDFQLLKGVNFILKESVDEALKLFQKSYLNINKHHCHYHFLGYKINYNIYSLKTLLKIENYEFYLNRANFLYNEEGLQTQKEKIENKKIKLINEEDFFLEDNHCEENLYIFKNNLIKNIERAEEFSKNKDYNKSLEEFEKINSILESQHFNYHCILSLHLFFLANIYLIKNNLENAKYFLEKALEQDLKNIFNDKIKDLLIKIGLHF